MNRVILSLGKGSLTEGFERVSAQLWKCKEKKLNVVGSLPANGQLQVLRQTWQKLYYHYYRQFDFSVRLELLEPEGIEFHEQDFQQICEQLKEQFNRWLKSENFSEINAQLRSHLNLAEEIQMIIETEDRQVQQLPWHLWTFFKDYRKAEVGFCSENYKRLSPAQKTSSTGIVKILSILGGNLQTNEIDLQQDRQILEQLPHTQIQCLTGSSRTQINALLTEQNWDIFFFAGHSSPQGLFLAQAEQNLSVSELESSLIASVEKGLQLAIFNSCESLELAWHLARLNIPLTLAMREVIPDIIAQEFLKHFLQAFAKGNSLYLSVRSAKEHLQALEADFPCASWLPVIFQNPTVAPPTWQQLRGERFPRLFTVLGMSGAIAALVIGLRSLGGLQPLELMAFDQLMRLRPLEAPDPRLVLVTITERDIQQLKQYPLSGSVILKTLKTLAQSQPKIIGLDIYRDLPVEPGHAALITYLQKNQNIVTVCEVGEPEVSDPNRIGVSPPPGSTFSFSDLLLDSDGTVRRHLFYLTPPTQARCQTSYAFSTELAFRYLDSQGIEAQATSQGNLKLNGVVFQPLEARRGFYQRLDARGHQILLNYRAAQKVARELTLTQVLNQNFNPSWIEGRVVLIGLTAPSAIDKFATPYGKGLTQKMPGVVIHAQMVSEIIDIAFKKRELLHFLPFWADNFWIFAASGLGSSIIIFLRRSLFRSLGVAFALIALCGISFGVLSFGISAPFVPSVLALILSWGIVLGFGLKPSSVSIRLNLLDFLNSNRFNRKN